MPNHRDKLQLAYLLDWSERDKCILLPLITIPLLLFYEAWLWYAQTYTDFGVLYLRPQGVTLMHWTLSVSMLGWLLLLAVGIGLRSSDRHSSLYVLVTIFFYSLSMVQLGYLIGVMSPLIGVVMLGATMVGFVLFDFLRVFLAFLLAVVLLVVLSVFTATEAIDYAPVFAIDPVSKFGSSTFWMVSQLMQALPFIVSTFGLTYMLLARWKQREQEALDLARSDALTGVANRRAIMDILKHELASTRRNSRPFSVVMMDIDHLKSINDTYGHDAGDQVLVGTAEAIQRTLRESDWVGRYGGEEFVLVFPQADAATAVLAVERLRNALATLVFDVGAASQLRVTASYGVYAVHGVDGSHEPPLERVLMRADAALQQAKQKGRNTFQVWEPDAKLLTQAS